MFGYPAQAAVIPAPRDLLGWLSIQADIQTYGGGAHPNHNFDSLVWDKRAGRALSPLEPFTSAKVLDGAVHQRFCDALDNERAERREETVEQVRSDETGKCPGVSELVIVLQASGGKGFDHLLPFAISYAAGSYVEGSYVAEVAVDAAVLGAVKPEYRTAFRASR
jgi:hypothetical protein